MTTINRGPYNALIDDDGTNTLGTVWGKNEIKTVLLDPIDVALAALDAVDATKAPATNGTYTATPFNAANFTANSGTWVVDSGDVLANSYTVIGKTLILNLYLLTTTVTGTNNELRMKLPNGYLAAQFGVTFYTLTDGGLWGTGQAFVGAGSDKVIFRKDVNATVNWTAGTNNVAVIATLIIPIQ